MNKFLVCVLLCFLYLACKKEYSYEQGQVSSGQLASFAGDCGLAEVKGNFTAREAIPAGSYAAVTVLIKRPGSYFIRTDTVNGYSFSARGVFTDTGTTSVQLTPHGTPLKQGINEFTVLYDSSLCQLHITVNANAADPASFTLSGAPGQCMNALVAGVFAKGVATDTSNKVSISVSVTTPGAYSISTNTVNGYSFSGAGSFLNPGVQLVTLSASGTPVAAGINLFTVTAGASSCSFSDTVLAPVAPANTDYFPLAHASVWVYDHTSYPNDSIVRTIIGAATINSKQYKIMDEVVPFFGHRQFNFRKEGFQYFEYAGGDEYTSSIVYSPPILKDLYFLQDNLAGGDIWSSEEYKGTASFGQVILMRYDFTCVAANSTANINGKVFVNVHKLRMRPQIRSESGPWGGTFEVYDLYYAKGVGLIYVKKTKNGFVESEQFLRRWQVN